VPGRIRVDFSTLWHGVPGLEARRPGADEEPEDELGVLYCDEDTVLREADFVTPHVPLLAGTRHDVAERERRLLKPTAYLVNAARRPVVDETAPIGAFREGWIAGAGWTCSRRSPACTRGF
jgi:phosphoglycerate dehydrogenase-like enzyme